jgi:hypothetical protein
MNSRKIMGALSALLLLGVSPLAWGRFEQTRTPTNISPNTRNSIGNAEFGVTPATGPTDTLGEPDIPSRPTPSAKEQAKLSNMTGVLEQVDPQGNGQSVRVLLPEEECSSVKQMGNMTQVTRQQGLVGYDMPVSKDVKIERDGEKISLSGLQPGDDVLVAYDAKTRKVIRIDARSAASEHPQPQTQTQPPPQ